MEKIIKLITTKDINNKNKINKKIFDPFINELFIYKKTQYSFLMVACIYKRENIIKLLLENKNININLQNNNGTTALMYACQKNLNLDIIKLLLDKNANLNLQTKKGNSALTIAIKSNNIEIVSLLASNHNINLDLKDREGETPLMKAILLININIVRILLDKGANINIKNNNNRNIFKIIEMQRIPNNIKEIILYTKNVQDFIEEIKKINNDKNHEKKVYDFTKKLYIDYNKDNGISGKKFECKINNELNDLLDKIKSNNSFYKKKISIQYISSSAVNQGGLLKNFFNNIEYQLNNKNYLENKLSETMKQLEKINNKKNNIIQPYIEQIANIHVKLSEITNISLEDKIKILIMSKINKNPIYIKNDIFKSFLLLKIRQMFKSDTDKNIIYHILNGTINNENLKYIVNSESSNLNTNSNYINTIKSIYKNKNIENFLNYYDKILENIQEQYMNKENIYINYIDFYVSHFIKFHIDKNEIIEKIEFVLKYQNNNNKINAFKIRFIEILNELTDDEILLFNKCISGSSTFISDKYIIQIFKSNEKNPKIENFHTCFSTLDIYNYEKFEELYLINKESFINMIKDYLKLGFSNK